MDVQSPIQHVSPKALVPNSLREKARTIPDKQQGRYLMIRDSIIANGIKTPLIVQRNTDTIIGGHTRCEIAIELELDTVPVQYVDVDYDEALYMLLEDNLDHAEDEKDIMKLAWQCKELQRLEGKERGRPQKMRHGVVFLIDNIAGKMGMSVRTFQRYVSLNKLIPELQSLVSAGKIGIAAGSILSQFARDSQEKVFESIKGAAFSNSYVMTKQDAEGFKHAFGPSFDEQQSNPDIVTRVEEESPLQDEEFYFEEESEDIDLDVHEPTLHVSLPASNERLESRALKVLLEDKNGDILSTAIGIDNEVDSGEMERKHRLWTTQKSAEEKMQNLLSIEDKEARQAFAVSKLKSALRQHQMAFERAEVELVSELAMLEPDTYPEIWEQWEDITRICGRMTKKFDALLEQVRITRVDV